MNKKWTEQPEEDIVELEHWSTLDSWAPWQHAHTNTKKGEVNESGHTVSSMPISVSPNYRN